MFSLFCEIVLDFSFSRLPNCVLHFFFLVKKKKTQFGHPYKSIRGVSSVRHVFDMYTAPQMK